MSHQTHRIYTFDLLRGLAVMTMMLAHGVYFFHSRDNASLVGLENFGNTISFVTFMLVSGAVTWIAYFGLRAGQVKRSRVLTRVLLMLLAYYLLALVVSGVDLLKAEGFARWRLLADLISFRHLPGFTEYFPPFFFYAALLALVPSWFQAASRSLTRVVLVSVVVYSAGWLLSRLPTGELWKPWLALVAGAEGLYRFPLLQYLPVYLLGLYWGHKTLTTEGLRGKRQLALNFGLFFGLVASGAWLGTRYLGWTMPTIFDRWPPSIAFLSLGLSFAFLAAWLLYVVRQLRRVRLLRDLLLTLGQNALGIFWSHIFLLSLYATAGGAQVSSWVLFIGLWLLLLVLSLALTTFLPFNFRLALTSHRGSHEEYEEALAGSAVLRLSQDVADEAIAVSGSLRRYFFPDRATGQRRYKKRHRLGLAIVVMAIASIIFPATIHEIALKEQPRPAATWWSNSYAYRQPVAIVNPEQFVTIQTGTALTIRLNHEQLVSQGKSRADGHDLKLTYWTGAEHLVAETFIDQAGSPQTTIRFKTPVDIPAGKSEEYFFLYYGAFLDATGSASKLESGQAIQANFGAETTYPLVATLSTGWTLLGQPGHETIQLNLTSTKTYVSETVTYRVLNTPINGTMERSTEQSWEAEIFVDDLAPGQYQIQATLVDDMGQEWPSQLTGFNRSEPLYVAWTQDWEGYDANQSYLNAIEDIADDFALPMTHFVNPRIYITESITPQRARALTQWIQRRIQLGDGFGLHLHLFLDFVEQAGVTVRTEPNWGDRGDGYGVPLSAYTKDEQKILIENAVNMLFDNGLPKTKTFRAGGWYANLDTLAALAELGFAVDSSARTKYSFGRNRLPGHWDISPTVRPYYPSRTNQNRPATTNAFPILEIPNNGADSYAFSAAVMIDRFTTNLGTGILTTPQQITYLSHPHWFDDQEQARVRELFARVSQYSFTADQGPVIFTTTDEIANLWDRGE